VHCGICSIDRRWEFPLKLGRQEIWARLAMLLLFFLCRWFSCLTFSFRFIVVIIVISLWFSILCLCLIIVFFRSLILFLLVWVFCSLCRRVIIVIIIIFFSIIIFSCRSLCGLIIILLSLRSCFLLLGDGGGSLRSGIIFIILFCWIFFLWLQKCVWVFKTLNQQINALIEWDLNNHVWHISFICLLFTVNKFCIMITTRQ